MKDQIETNVLNYWKTSQGPDTRYVMGKNQWVVRHGDGWAQRGEGNSRVTRTFDTQREAIDSARETARRESSELFVQNESGRIRERNSYGHDPHPPKG